MTSYSLREYVPGQIWLKEYAIRYAGTRCDARMTLIRLEDGKLLVHSPAPVDAATRAEVAPLGEVAFIVAPGNFHYFHVAAWQREFPEAETWICPGVDRKRPKLAYDGMLGNDPPPAWADHFEQVLVEGSRWMWEVAFFHRASRTLLLVDLIENIGDATPHTNWALRFYWKFLLRMWNRARPAPEYQFGWRDKQAARSSLERIMDWDFQRIIIAHGENIDDQAKDVAARAWARILTPRKRL